MASKRKKSTRTNARINDILLRGQRPGRVGHDQPSARAECVSRADARRNDRRAEIDARRPVDRVRGGDRRRRQVVFRGRRFLRDEAAQFDQRLHVERPHAGAGDDDPRPADSGDRDGQRLVHGRRPRTGAVVRSGDRLGKRGARPDRRQGRRVPDGGCDAVPAAPHRRAARARNDFLRAPLQRQGSGRGRPHQQMRAAEGSAQGNAQVVRNHERPQRADASA